MLGRLSGRSHEVMTGVAVLGGPTERSFVEITTVRFAELTSADIDTYVATGEPLDKAGAYGIQGRAASLVESIDGDFYTVMGFPLARFVRTLRRLGFSLPVAKPTAP
jgi:septum formation protein